MLAGAHLQFSEGTVFSENLMVSAKSFTVQCAGEKRAEGTQNTGAPARDWRNAGRSDWGPGMYELPAGTSANESGNRGRMIHLLADLAMRG